VDHSGLNRPSFAHEWAMATPEPGLDRHEWESELASLDDDLRDSPSEALPALAGLVGRMLEERGYDLDDPVVSDGDDREVVAQFRAAREVADRVDLGEDVDPGDVADAINGLRELFGYVIAERETP
jgi:hypothetical protein